jgi:F-type H+-transporting ATPase subunit delta
MKETRAANRYAAALLDLALEKNSLDKVKQDMDLIKKTCSQNHDLVLLLNSPIVKSDKKIKILTEIFKGKISDLSLSFITLVANKRREGILPQVCDEFIGLYNTYKGIQLVEVTSVDGLDDNLRKKVYELVKGNSKSEIELVEKTDKDLIGGFILRIGDKQIDSSIVRSIKKMKNNLTH